MAFLVIAGIAFSLTANWLVKRSIERLINRSSDRPYNITARSVELHALSGTLTINGLSLSPRHSYRDSASGMVGISIRARSKKVVISGLSLLQLLLHSELKIGELKLEDPDIIFAFNPDQIKKGNGGTQGLWSDRFKRAGLGKLNIEGGRFRMFNLAKDSTSLMDVDSVFIGMTGVEVDSVKLSRLIPFAYKKAQIDFRSLRANLGPNYQLAVHRFSLDNDGHVLRIIQPRLIPTRNDSTFDLRKGAFLADAKSLVLQGWSTDEFFLQNSAHLDSLVVNSPSIIYIRPGKGIDSTRLDTTHNHNGQLPLRYLAASLVKIQHGDLIIQGQQMDKDSLFYARNINLNIRDLLLDSAQNGKFSPFQISSIALQPQADTLKCFLPDRYALRVSSLNWDNKDSVLDIKGVKIFNSQSVEAYFRRKKYETDYYYAEIPKLKFAGFDLNKFLLQGTFSSSDLYLNSFFFKAYRDKRKPSAPFQKKLLPGQVFRQIPFPFTVENLHSADSKVIYTEMADKPGPVTYGEIKFEHINASGTDLSNDSTYIAAHPKAMLSVVGLFLNRVSLDLTYTFDLKSQEAAFEADGHVDPFDFSLVNQITGPLANVQFTSGSIQSIHFHFKANDNQAKGWLKMPYQNLSLKVLSANNSANDPHNSDENGLVSFLANSFLLKKNNDQAHLKTGEISLMRQKNKSFFHYTFHAFETGVLNTILPKFAAEKIKKKTRQGS